MLKTVAAAVLMGLALIAIPAAAQSYPEMRLKYAVHVPASNVVAEADKYFADEVKRRSGGRIVIDIYWNRALAKQSEVLPLVAAGAIDFSTLEAAQYGETPLTGFANALPMTFFDAGQLMDVSRSLYRDSSGIRTELEKLGLIALWVRPLPNYQLLCRKPYRTVADLEGARLRSYGAYVPLMWQAIGANAVNVVASELYDGLAKGTFDCAYLPPPFLADYKLQEAAKYLLDIPFGMIEFAPVIVGEEAWDSWPAEVRQLFTEVAADTEAFAVRRIEADAGLAVERMVKDGVEIVRFEETAQLRGKIPNMLDVWLEMQRDAGRGPDAEEIVSIARAKLGE
ncbi:TRAP transporter substrate-binding protein DctP [Inquilinus sp. OTU3971]|uniref:TRAP transporter substrate-binding protein DctP n=1 Tax=Inquilinus sp. OTU3971 TaxID=3043855 RepID=UPI00313BCB2F